MVLVADDHMVNQLDLQQLTGTNEIPRHFDVSFRGRGFPARMIMLCAALVYVQLAVGGVGLNSGAMGKGWLCLTADHSNNLARNRVFAD